MARILFLDIDGVLTTADSRLVDATSFSPAAVAAMTRLVSRGRPDKVVVHSTWRKLPEPPGYGNGYCWSHDYWYEVCQAQGLQALTKIPHEDAPYTKGTQRGAEICWWLAKHHQPEHRYVILDDELHKFSPMIVGWSHCILGIATRDEEGLTLEQAERAVDYWSVNQDSGTE